MTTPMSLYWSALINTPDEAEAVGEFTYQVEAGTARRKNRQAEAADMNMLVQTLMPTMLSVWQTSGDPTGINNLIGLVGTTLERPVSGLLLPAFSPQPMLPAPGEGEPASEPVPEEAA